MVVGWGSASPAGGVGVGVGLDGVSPMVVALGGLRGSATAVSVGVGVSTERGRWRRGAWAGARPGRRLVFHRRFASGRRQSFTSAALGCGKAPQRLPGRRGFG